MDIEYADRKLERLAIDKSYRRPGLDPEATKKYRKVIAWILRASDEQELRAVKSLHMEKLKGDRKGSWSLRVHAGLRLIIRRKKDTAGRIIVVVELIDYH